MSRDWDRAFRLFRRLEERAKGHPMFLSPQEDNRWYEDGMRPKHFRGTIVELPYGLQYGRIESQELPRRIPVRSRDLYFDVRGGEMVSFEIIFNMAGPQASKVVAITR